MSEELKREEHIKRLVELSSDLNRLDRVLRETMSDMSRTICMMVNIMDNPEFDKYQKRWQDNEKTG